MLTNCKEVIEELNNVDRVVSAGGREIHPRLPEKETGTYHGDKRNGQLFMPKTHSLKICLAVRSGMKKRIRADEKKMAIIIQKVIEDKRLSEVETGIWNRYDDRQCKEECLCSLDVVAGIDEHWKEQAYPDHVNGGYLEASKVLQARKKEMAYVYK